MNDFRGENLEYMMSFPAIVVEVYKACKKKSFRNEFNKGMRMGHWIKTGKAGSCFDSNPQMVHLCRIELRNRHSVNGSGKCFWIDMRNCDWFSQLKADLKCSDIQTCGGKSIKGMARCELCKHGEFFVEGLMSDEIVVPLRYSLKAQIIIGFWFQTIKDTFCKRMALKLSKCQSKERMSKFYHSREKNIRHTMSKCFDECKVMDPEHRSKFYTSKSIIIILGQYIRERTGKSFGGSDGTRKVLIDRMCNSVGEECDQWLMAVPSEHKKHMCTLQNKLRMKHSSHKICRDDHFNFYCGSLEKYLKRCHVSDHDAAIKIILGIKVIVKRGGDDDSRRTEDNKFEEDPTNLFDDVMKNKLHKKKPKKKEVTEDKRGLIVLSERRSSDELKDEFNKRMNGIKKEFNKFKKQEKKSQKQGSTAHEFFVIFVPKLGKFRREIHVMRVPKKDVINRRDMPRTRKVPKSVVDIGLSNPKFSTFMSLLQKAKLVDTLKNAGAVTLFVPTNKAFSKLSKDELNFLVSDKGIDQLKETLLYHAVSGKIDSKQVMKLKKITTLTEKDINVKVRDGVVILNNKTRVISVDAIAGNGIIHVVNSVLTPPVDEDLDEDDLDDLDVFDEDLDEEEDVNINDLGEDEFTDDEDEFEDEGPIDNGEEDEENVLTITPEGSVNVSHSIIGSSMTTTDEFTGLKREGIPIEEYQIKGWNNTIFLMEK